MTAIGTFVTWLSRDTGKTWKLYIVFW
jgi:hypothetical protein